MSLTVLSVAYSLATVGVDAVGGAEQVLTQLDAALVRLGHTSIVVAHEGSTTRGTLLAVPAPRPPFDDAVRLAQADRQRERVAEALRRFRVNVVHMHGIDFYRCLPPPGAPTVVTLHLPPSWYPDEALHPTRPETYLHCVSATQRRSCPPGVSLLPDLPNGVPVAELEGQNQDQARARTSALTLGRICPEKGFHLAIDAAKRADMPLLLAGRVYEYAAHEQYFRGEIAPRLDERRRFVGPVGFARKRRLLASARCLLVPSLVPETSSLVAMEALACGTPVIAFRVGALPEIVEHGRTGFLVDDVAQMADAMRAAESLDAEQCRAAARERFSDERMVAQYLDMYRRLAGGADHRDPAELASVAD